jgi:hypothetical protein
LLLKVWGFSRRLPGPGSLLWFSRRSEIPLPSWMVIPIRRILSKEWRTRLYLRPTSRGKMLKRFLVFFILLAVLFTGCQQSKNSLVTLHGLMLVKDPINAMPAEDNAIYLVPLPSDQMVISVPSIPSDNAIQARVDNKTGEFVFSKISPGKYVIIVLTIYGGQIPAKMENGSMAVIDVQESDLNKTVELNNLFVP